jgi:hypothetical protein
MRYIAFILLLFAQCASQKMTVPKNDMKIDRCFKVIRVEVIKENPQFRTIYFKDTCRSR